ncbi:hypothetical protein M422DRAFT_785060 [Sphaerobolus stellatus SS14]|uniref:Uncharacterized protein n=1 Tax=Sphaerobolus stellatus (strain SS14) TaxID=990650 RepID=A0A0C9UNX3_SPHS4|nr:hypothetical protein M422DRAFT_785060 [Sphaerobolus stellatus SS14]
MATAEPSRGLKAPPKPPRLSRAEMRAKQEKDRAVKEAVKAQGGGKNAAKGSASKGPSASSSTSQQQSLKASKATESAKVPHSSKDLPPAITTHETAAQQTRGLRIFSHFGVPRDTKTLKLKGTTIHPAIIRLGLQFSEFKIVGANARCVAMLNAFKTVRDIHYDRVMVIKVLF